MGQYRSASDIHQMLVIPGHQFLRCARSRCLFLSACLNVLLDLQLSDNCAVAPPNDSTNFPERQRNKSVLRLLRVLERVQPKLLADQ